MGKSKWNSRKLVFAIGLLVLFSILLSVGVLGEAAYVQLVIPVVFFYYGGKAAECYINKEKQIDA